MGTTAMSYNQRYRRRLYMSWFKHGVQYDAVCNAFDRDGKKAKPAITVFSLEDTMTDAILTVIDELNKHGYTNITVDKITRIKP